MGGRDDSGFGGRTRTRHEKWGNNGCLGCLPPDRSGLADYTQMAKCGREYRMGCRRPVLPVSLGHSVGFALLDSRGS